MSRRSRGRTMRSALSWIKWWGFGLVLWLVFTTTIDRAELAVGAAVAAVTASLAIALGSHHAAALGAVGRRGFLIPRLGRAVLVDTAVVFAALARHVTGRKAVRGRYVMVPFRHGRPDDRRDIAGRAAATAALSLPPNSIVIGVDADLDEIMVHQLVPDAEALDRLLGQS